MRSLNEAIQDCLSLSPARQTVRKPTSACVGQYLSESIHAHHPMPLWDQSAMDGYAVRSSEAMKGSLLKVGEVIPAGHWPEKELALGEAARIFTGAPLPQGADSVLIQENTTAIDRGARVRVNQNVQMGANVRRVGEEIALNTRIAKRGDQVTPGLLGLCAAQGITHLKVFSEPRISLLETGTELASPGTPLKGAQIYASNAVTLAPIIRQSGGHLITTGRVSDEVDAVTQQISAQLSEGVQVMITTGGVSVGDFDPIHEAIERLGAKRVFWKVKMKPGKPVSIAQLDRPEGGHALLIGLPGNPVSCVVTYLLFVHPLIQHLCGHSSDQLGLRKISCRLSQNISKRHHRAELFRVALEAMESEGESVHKLSYRCRLTGGQSSAWISSIAMGDGLLYAPSEPCEFRKGEMVEVSLFPWREILMPHHLFNAQCD